MFLFFKSILIAVALSVILISSIYFSIRLSFRQFNFLEILKSLFFKNIKGSIKSLFVALSGRIGVGSIAGVAVAIIYGGAGTIFWMWIVALVTGVLAYAESYLAVKFKSNVTGPSCYIKYGLNKNSLALVYSFIVIAAYLIGFIPIQANTVINSTNFNKFILGFVLFLGTFFVLKRGVYKIINLIGKIIPLIGFIYISMTFYVIILNISSLPLVFKNIFTCAFNLKSFFSSFIPMVIIAIQRCIFSNESGLGLGALAIGASDSTNPRSTALVQVFGVYVVTMIVCTSSAFLLLMTPYTDTLVNNINGIEVIKMAFNYHFGCVGGFLLFICIFLFAFSTVLSGYYYIVSSASFIGIKNFFVFNFLVSFSVFFGCLLNPSFIWDLVDIMVAIMAIINVYSLYKLRNSVK